MNYSWFCAGLLWLRRKNPIKGKALLLWASLTLLIAAFLVANLADAAHPVRFLPAAGPTPFTTQ